MVLAGEIVWVFPAGCYVNDVNGNAVLRTFQPEMTARRTPVPGDFWVLYEDGYASISPRLAFLNGYVPA